MLYLTQRLQININRVKSLKIFWREGKTGVPRDKHFGAEQTNNKLNPHTVLSPKSNLGHIGRRHHCSHLLFSYDPFALNMYYNETNQEIQNLKVRKSQEAMEAYKEGFLINYSKVKRKET